MFTSRGSFEQFQAVQEAVHLQLGKCCPLSPVSKKQQSGPPSGVVDAGGRQSHPQHLAILEGVDPSSLGRPTPVIAKLAELHRHSIDTAAVPNRGWYLWKSSDSRDPSREYGSLVSMLVATEASASLPSDT